MSTTPNHCSRSAPRRLGPAGLLILLLVAPACTQNEAERELVLQIPHTTSVREFGFTPDGRWLFTVDRGNRGRVLQWNVDSGELVRSFAAIDFEISLDGQNLLLMIQDGPRYVPTLVAANTGELLQRIEVGAPYADASMTTDGRYVFVAWGKAVWEHDSHSGILWDMTAGKIAWDSNMPSPVDATADDWTTDFVDGPPWVIERLKEDRKSVLFWRSVRPDGKVLITHNPVSGVSATPDGKQILVRRWDDTGSSTDDTTYWDTASAQPMRTFAEPYDIDQPFQYGPDKTWFARGIYSKTATLCERSSGKELRRFEGHKKRIMGLDVSPDGEVLATASDDGTAMIWDRRTGQAVRTIRDICPDGLCSVEFSPDGQQLLIGTSRNQAILYDRSGEMVRELDVAGREFVDLIAGFSPDGKHVATRGRNDHRSETIAAVWHTKTGKQAFDVMLPLMTSLTIEPSAEHALAWPRRERPSELVLWQLGTASEVHHFEDHVSGWQRDSSDVSEDAYTTPGGVRLYGWCDKSRPDLNPMRIAFPQRVETEIAAIQGITPATTQWLGEMVLKSDRVWPRTTQPNDRSVISPDGAHAAAWGNLDADERQGIVVQRIEDGAPVGRLPLAIDDPTAVAFSPNGTKLLVTLMSPTKRAGALLWDFNSGTTLWTLDNLLFGPYHECRNIVFSPNGRYAALGTDRHLQTVIVDATSGETLIKSDGQAAFNDNGQFVFLRGDADLLWNVRERKVVCNFGRHRPTNTVVFSPNGQLVFHCTRSGQEGLYSTRTGELVAKTGPPISSFAEQVFWYDGDRFGRDGTRLVSRQWDNIQQPRASLWDFESGGRIRDLRLPDGSSIDNATFSPDGRRLITMYAESLPTDNGIVDRQSWRCGMIVWDANDGEQLAMGVGEANVRESPARKLLFVPDQDVCLSLHSDGLTLWNLDSGAVERSFPVAGGADLTAAVSPDGKSLLTVGSDTKAIVWDISTGQKTQQFAARRVTDDETSESIWTPQVRFTDDNRRLLVESHHGRGLHLMSIETGQRLWSFFLLGDGQAVSLRANGTVNSNSPSLIRYRRAGTHTLVAP